MAEKNAAFVGSIPENYDRYLGPVLFDPYARDLVARLSIAAGASVLELACGTGIVTRHLRDRLGANVKIVATDLNQAMMDYAAQKFHPEDNIEWKQADATDLPFADQSFEAVVCQFGLMFFPDKEKAARETLRVLKPGGVLLFNVWDEIEVNDLPKAAHAVILKFFPNDPPDFYDVPFSFHDPEAIRTLLSAAGFKDIKLTTVPLPATSPSAPDLAQGLIHGNPVITAIKERDESKAPEIQTTLENLLASEFGSAPVCARMQAIVCTGIR